jgi:TetR/AcrR family transcriptional regulator, transcriptional repressor for nem operon
MGIDSFRHTPDSNTVEKSKRDNGTREKLLDKGVAILSEQGYHGTGLKQILDSAQIPKGSFYNYFESKDEYGAEVIRHYTDQVVAQCDAFLNSPGADGLSALRKYIDAFIEKSRAGGYKEGCLLGNLGADIGDAGESCVRALKSSLTRVQERFETALRQAQDEGTVRRDLPPAIMAELLLNAWEGAIMRMRVEKSTQPLEEISEFLLQGYFRAPNKK